MIKFIIAGIIILSFKACNLGFKENNVKSSNSPVIKHMKILPDTLDEEFVDSNNIAISGKYKVELRKYHGSDSTFVIIDFFEKHSKKWLKKQELEFRKDDWTECFVETSDFNNDGFNDLTFKSAVAARGANDVRKLLIFDKAEGKLIFIKNSENYPNMQYNKKLNCIDALLVSGCWVTVFLHLEKDTLREFANVNECDDKITVNTISKKGVQRCIVSNKNNTFGDFPRFKNYMPLEE